MLSSGCVVAVPDRRRVPKGVDSATTGGGLFAICERVCEVNIIK